MNDIIEYLELEKLYDNTKNKKIFKNTERLSYLIKNTPLIYLLSSNEELLEEHFDLISYELFSSNCEDLNKNCYIKPCDRTKYYAELIKSLYRNNSDKFIELFKEEYIFVGCKNLVIELISDIYDFTKLISHNIVMSSIADYVSKLFATNLESTREKTYYVIVKKQPGNGTDNDEYITQTSSFIVDEDTCIEKNPFDVLLPVLDCETYESISELLDFDYLDNFDGDHIRKFINQHKDSFKSVLKKHILNYVHFDDIEIEKFLDKFILNLIGGIK